MKTIYVNGDSFPAGAELADHLLPSWPGYIRNDSFSYYSAANWNTIRLSEINLFPGGPAEFQKKEKELAWPSLISKNYDINVINSSKSGASLGGILKRTCVDLLELQANSTNIDKVFIQLTTLDRTEVYKNTPDNRHFDDLPLTNLVSYSDNNSIEQKIGKTYLNYTDEDLAAKFLYNILALEQVVFSMTRTFPIYLSTGLSEYTVTLLNNIATKYSSIDRLLSLSRLGKIDVKNKSMKDIHLDNEFMLCPAGHFEQRTHVAFAQEIYENYLK